MRRLLDLLLPALCSVCGAPAERRELLCPGCATKLERVPPQRLAVPGIDEGWAAGPHDGIVRELVSALKFRRRLPLARVAAEHIAAMLPIDPVVPLVPVPASPTRHRLRGFDPATAIATELARISHTRVVLCLHRLDRGRQVGRRRCERLSDPPRVEAFRPPPPALTLVDDVVTTGATLGACAAALRDRGCDRVLAIAVARA